MTEYDKWMLLLEWLDSDNEDMFEDELTEVICARSESSTDKP
jgi:hypothetical protein